MNNWYKHLLMLLVLFVMVGCRNNASTVEAKNVNKQQAQYAIGQSVPVYNWSLERHLIIQLYNVRNKKVATHSVWRSDRGVIEGDCPSFGYGIPYDTSLTNPLVATDEDQYGNRSSALTTIEQPEPNGVYASKNTQATWVMCLGDSGVIEPVYVEAKVTVYPGPVDVDYLTGRVVRNGAATILINKQ
jgi:hypothetical protein